MKWFLSELRLYVCNHIICSIPFNCVRLLFYRRVMGFNLEQGVAIDLGVRFDCARNLKIGRNSVVNENCRLDCRGGITIGSGVAVAAQSIILTADHDHTTPGFPGRTRPVVIEDDVFIGTRAMILPGVTLYKGAIVAAGGVVTRHVKSMDIVAGVPARPIGIRKHEATHPTGYTRFLH